MGDGFARDGFARDDFEGNGLIGVGFEGDDFEGGDFVWDGLGFATNGGALELKPFIPLTPSNLGGEGLGEAPRAAFPQS